MCRTKVNSATMLTGLALTVLVACGGQPAQQPAGSPCEEAVNRTGQAVQQTAEILAAEAVADATDPPAEPPTPSGDLPQQVPGMLRQLAEAHGQQDAIAQVDDAASEAADACGGKATAYDKISQHLEQRVPRYLEQHDWPETPRPSEVNPSTYWAATLLGVSSEEFGIAADSAGPAPSSHPSSLPRQFPVHDTMTVTDTRQDGSRHVVIWAAPPGSFEELRLFYEDKLQRGGPQGWHVSDSSGQISADAQGQRPYGRSTKTFEGFGYRGTIQIDAPSPSDPVTVQVTIQET